MNAEPINYEENALFKRNNDVIGIFTEKNQPKPPNIIVRRKKGDKARRKHIHWECGTDQAKGNKNNCKRLLHKFGENYK